MKKYMSIILGKLTVIIGKLLKKDASVMPGAVSLKIDENILSKFSLPPLVIAVTGSSGKGSTTKLIVDILKSNGLDVIYNKNSNLKRAITSLLIENCTLSGRIKKDAIVMELDERYTKLVFPYIKPNYVVITNITRDQPPRQGHFDIVYNDIKKSLDSSMHLILNGDDPYLRKFNLNNEYKTTYYGLDKNKYSYTNSKFENLNIVYCPKCHNKLKYNFYNFETLGNYYCPNCDFKNPDYLYRITNINYKKNELIINNNTKLNISNNILYCAYNMTAAFTVCSLLGFNNIEDIINSNTLLVNNSFNYKDIVITTLNNKNENSSTFNQSLLYIDRFKEKKTIVIGWKEISRRYNHEDLSWLYDIDFEILKKCNIDKIICVGINRFDIALRLKYSGIKENKILIYENLVDTTKYLKEKNKCNIYAILNFDYVEPFNNLMKEGK